MISAEEYELVRPVVPPTASIDRFSTIDNYVARCWHITVSAFEYGEQPMEIPTIFEHLKTGLSYALTDVPVWAGTLIADKHHPRRFHSQNDPNSATVLKFRDYREHKLYKNRFRELKARHFPIIDMKSYGYLIPQGAPPTPCAGSPNLFAQANFFPEGMLLTVAYCHVGVDLVAMESFLVSWSTNCARSMSGNPALCHPFASAASRDRTRMSQGDDSATIDDLPGYFLYDMHTAVPLQMSAPLEPNHSILCRLPARKLAQLSRPNAKKAKIGGMNALAAFAWQSLVQARMAISGVSPIGTSTLLTGIDVRRRLRNPPASNYMGAAVSLVEVKVPRTSLLMGTVGASHSIPTAVEQAVHDWDPSRTDKLIGILGNLPHHMLILPSPPELFFTSHVHCTTSRKSWGPGLSMPLVTREPYYGRVPPRNELMVHPRCLNGDVEFSLTAERSAIIALLAHAEFREYVNVFYHETPVAREETIMARL